MFFGQKITQNQAFEIIFPKDTHQFILSNIALDVKSQASQIYLKNKGKQILLLQLDRKMNLINSPMMININHQEKCELVSRKGNVYVCGHFLHNNKTENDFIKNDNANQVDTSHNRQKSDQKQKQQVKQLKNYIQPVATITTEQPNLVARRSSRLSTKVESSYPKITKLQTSKKQQKIVKKQSKQKQPESKIINGRSSLKALLNSIDDDQDDSDQQFDEPSSQQSDEDDSSQNQDQDQQEPVNTSKRLSSIHKNHHINKSNSLNETTIVEINVQKQVIENIQITLEKDQSKCAQSQNDSSNILIDEQKMQQLAMTIKVPVKRPTI